MYLSYRVIFHLLSKLGRSIQKQVSGIENVRELCDQIDSDMEGGYRRQSDGAGFYFRKQ